jgi:ATP-dependent DNA helicase DinG
VLGDRLLHHIDATDGGAFVLFTSFAVLNACADRLSARLALRAYPFFVQGRDGPPGRILAEFRKSERSVLFGAASFWQGVDVRGDTLRNVIITKLPFDPPDRPLVEARCDLIKARGGDPFKEESLPRALLRFRQGFGRLIRSSTDRGQVVILDKRVVGTGYGRVFLKALPAGVPVETVRAKNSEVEAD